MCIHTEQYNIWSFESRIEIFVDARIYWSFFTYYHMLERSNHFAKFISIGKEISPIEHMRLVTYHLAKLPVLD